LISGLPALQDALTAMTEMETALHASTTLISFKMTTVQLLVAASMELTSTVLLCNAVPAQQTAPHAIQTNNALLAVDTEMIMA
jgi:hypothetical protein